nr:energy transducer TonB [Rhodoplanes tepidamans]
MRRRPEQAPVPIWPLPGEEEPDRSARVLLVGAGLSVLAVAGIVLLVWTLAVTGDRVAGRRGDGVRVTLIDPQPSATTAPAPRNPTPAETAETVPPPAHAPAQDAAEPAAAPAPRPYVDLPRVSGRAATDALVDDPGLGAAASSYQASLETHIGRFRRYPDSARRQRLQGTVQVRFEVDRDGTVLDVRVVSSSGHAALDSAAMDTIRRAAPLPPIPQGFPDRLDVLLPVEFALSRTGADARRL